MKMNTIAALGAVLIVAAQANAGGMPPDYEIDANGVPLGGIEPVTTILGPVDTLEEHAEPLTTAAVDGPQITTTAMPSNALLATAIFTEQIDPAKDHR